MDDYSRYKRYKTETLLKMRDKAWEKYYEETRKPCGYSLSRAWVKAKERYDEISNELKSRGIR